MGAVITVLYQYKMPNGIETIIYNFQMLINSIKLSNFKNFEDVEVKLGKMNVIVGANASGKSNFLQALKFLRDIKDFGIDNAISMQGGIEYLRNMQLKDNKVTKISVSFIPKEGRIIEKFANDTIFLDYSMITYTIEITTKSSDEYEILKEEFIYDTNIKIAKLKINFFETILNEKILNEATNFRALQFILSAHENKATLLNPVKPDEKIAVDLSDGNTMVINNYKVNPFSTSYQFSLPFDIFYGAYNPNNKTLLERFYDVLPMYFLDFSIYDFELKKAKQSTPITGKMQLEENGENLALVLKNILADKEKQRQFSNLLTDILPFIKGLNTEKFYDKSLSFKIQEIYNASSHLPSSLLSDGTIAVTAIIVALFFEHKNLAIFEEPEHGVHPALIAKLMQNFYDASEKKQVIITTHSPEILKHIKNLDDLLFVSRNEKGFGQITKPIEQEMVKAFLENELGIDQLFTQNLLDN